MNKLHKIVEMFEDIAEWSLFKSIKIFELIYSQLAILKWLKKINSKPLVLLNYPLAFWFS